MSQLFFLSTLSYQFWRIKLLTKTATIILRAPTRAPFMINELKVVYLYIFLKFVLYEDNWRNLKSLYYIIRDWQSRGREFESHLLHDEAQCDCKLKFKKLTKLACVGFLCFNKSACFRIKRTNLYEYRCGISETQYNSLRLTINIRKFETNQFINT